MNRAIYKDWTIFELLWLSVFTLINLYLFFMQDDSLIGLISSITGMICVILGTKGKISNYFFGIIKIISYTYIAYTYMLYSEVLLNVLFYLPLQFIGLYMWNKHKLNDDVISSDVKIKVLNKVQWLQLICISLVSIILYNAILWYFDANTTGIDSLTVIFSIVAQILMVKRYAEQWFFWSLVNISAIILWVIALQQSGGNNYNLIVMWSAFLITSSYGYINWLQMYRKQNQVA